MTLGALMAVPGWAVDHPHIWVPAVVVTFVVTCCVKRRQIEGIMEEAAPLLTSAVGVWGVGQLFVFAGSKTAGELGPLAWPLSIAGVVALMSIVPGFIAKCWNLWSGPDIATPTGEPHRPAPQDGAGSSSSPLQQSQEDEIASDGI